MYSVYYSWCYCEVTWERKWLYKSNIGWAWKMRMTIYYTTVHSFVYFFYIPLTCKINSYTWHGKVSSIYDIWDLILSLNLVPLDWGFVNLKTDYFPVIIWHAVTEQGQGNRYKHTYSKSGRREGAWLLLVYSNIHILCTSIAWPLSRE